jgi:hypothetical protein
VIKRGGSVEIFTVVDGGLSIASIAAWIKSFNFTELLIKSNANPNKIWKNQQIQESGAKFELLGSKLF